MAGIKAGDNGTDYEFLIRDGSAIVPLNGATVDVVIKNGDRRLPVKNALIIDAANGICKITLTREDLATPGGYILQGIVKFPDDGDKDFASDVVKFPVGARI